MKALKSHFIGFGLLLIVTGSHAQESEKIKPFSISIGSITVSGSYTEGRLYRNTVSSTNILWGLITWGGNEVIDCRPGTSICIIDFTVSVGFKGFTTNQSGERCISMPESPEGTNPILINTDGTDITFAVNLDHVSASQRALYEGAEWRLEEAFIIGPNIVKQLSLHEGKDSKGFVIPAGSYSLKRDGNIRYWTWQRPR